MRLTNCAEAIHATTTFPRLALTFTLMLVGLVQCGAVPRNAGQEARPRSQTGLATAAPALPQSTSGCAEFRNISLASVEVTPTEMHKTVSPNRAVVTVKVQYDGPGPVAAGAEATVAAYTDFADPVGSNVAYGPTKSIGGGKALTLALRSKTTIFQFSVYPAPPTVTGNVRIRATITGTRGCVAVVDRTGVTILKTVVP